MKPKERLAQVGQQGRQDRKDGAQGLGDGKAAGLEGGWPCSQVQGEGAAGEHVAGGPLKSVP